MTGVWWSKRPNESRRRMKIRVGEIGNKHHARTYHALRHHHAVLTTLIKHEALIFFPLTTLCSHMNLCNRTVLP